MGSYLCDYFNEAATINIPVISKSQQACIYGILSHLKWGFGTTKLSISAAFEDTDPKRQFVMQH